MFEENRRRELRKWCGVFFLLLEMNLLGGTIFGFPALFGVLAQENIYGKEIKEYQNAMTLGIAFFDLPAFFIGFFIDRFGSRTVKLISIIFHLIGWLALALLKPGRDSLLYIHCVFASLSGITVLLTSYASSNYFSKSRAFVASLIAGAGLSATMWFSVFEYLIERGKLTLSQLSYIWLALSLLMLFTSFAFLDWPWHFCNLPYQYDRQLEENPTDHSSAARSFWKHLFSPMYILVVLFLSILIIPTVFLSVFWSPFISHLTGGDPSEANRYTFAYNLSTLSAILICPINGSILGYKADRSQKRKLLNICIVESVSWFLNIVLCVICMFLSREVLIPILILNIISRSTIVAGCQSVICTFFPSQYIGRLTGIMWTIVGAFTFLQFALIRLTEEISLAWRAWVVILALCVLMSIHLIQIWIKFFRERKKQSKDLQLTTHRF